jgi:subtilisin family serine protease
MLTFVAAAALPWALRGGTPVEHGARATVNPRAIHVKLAPGATEVALLDVLDAGRAAGILALDADPMFVAAPALLAAERDEATRRSGVAAPDLTRWWRIHAGATDAQLAALAAALADAPGIVEAFVEPEVVPAGLEDSLAPTLDATAGACPIKTPRYDEHQGYLSASPDGIDAPAAWGLPGGRGQGVWFADVEGAWNTRHEDLPGDRMSLVAGRRIEDRGWEAHGTAVVGMIAARENELGMVGIAPDIERVVTASIGTIGAAGAIHAAQAALRPGDVLLIELQGLGPRNRYIPVEWWNDVFEVVSVATGRGVIVVAAAGNGNEDLDHKRYRGAFDARQRDSGAIVVGAGAPPRPGFTDRSRLDFSNYGARVDVQGWGRRVATLDYGDLQSCSGLERHYTGEFAGTSSASPVVAGAAILAQGIYKAATGRALTPSQMRDLLRANGAPQTNGPFGGVKQHIGPRPDLARVIDALPR